GGSARSRRPPGAPPGAAAPTHAADEMLHAPLLLAPYASKEKEHSAGRQGRRPRREVRYCARAARFLVFASPTLRGGRPIAGGALAEEDAAETDVGRALLDRQLEVLGHAHGELTQVGEIQLAAEPVAQLAQRPEVAAERRLVAAVGRDRHQPRQADA